MGGSGYWRNSSHSRGRPPAGVEDTEEADLGAEPLRIGRDLDQKVGDGTNQRVVECERVGPDQGIDSMREREHQMEVRRGEQFRFANSVSLVTGIGIACNGPLVFEVSAC